MVNARRAATAQSSTLFLPCLRAWAIFIYRIYTPATSFPPVIFQWRWIMDLFCLGLAAVCYLALVLLVRGCEKLQARK